MRVRWLARALDNIDQIAAYIAADNPTAAQEAANTIWRATQQLADFPGMGRPGRVEGTRELVIQGHPYVLPYIVREREMEVLILRVLHTSMKWPTSF